MSGDASENYGKASGRQPVPWSDAADIFRRERFPGSDIPDGKERATKYFAFFLFVCQIIAHGAERLFGCADILHHLFEFGRLHAERAVRAAIGAGEGEVFFHHCRAESYRRHGHGAAHCMVREAGLAAEGVRQVRDGAQVRFFRWGRVGAGAFEQRQFPRAVLAQGAHRLVDFRQRRHTRRQDNGLARCRDFFEQGRVHQLETRDLVPRNIAIFQKIHGSGVKRGGKAVYPQIFGERHQAWGPFPGGVGFLIEVMERAAFPERPPDAEIFVVAGDSHGVGGVGLELDGIRARVGRGAHYLFRALNAAVVVGRKLGNDKDSLRGWGGRGRDRGGVGHWSLSWCLIANVFAGSFAKKRVFSLTHGAFRAAPDCRVASQAFHGIIK